MLAADTSGKTLRMHCCRLCTANDPNGVVERIAARLWESRYERAWDDAGEYCQRIFRKLASAAASLR